jgi:hypothetical protein
MIAGSDHDRFCEALLGEIGYAIDETMDAEEMLKPQHTRPRAPRHKAPTR